MLDYKRCNIVAITASTLVISYLQYSTAQAAHATHDIYREFYYLPVLLGAFAFGIKGAALTYLLIVATYLPYIGLSWTGETLSEINKFLHLFLQGAFALLAGFLIDRDRKRREQSERDRYLAGIGQVATTIVHDLKNPLITILGFVRRLEADRREGDFALQAIKESALNMQKIVHDVLDFSKPIQLKLEKESMKNTINRACNSCRTRAEGEGINLIVTLPSDPLDIVIDGFHLERALVNLINNAVDASPKGQTVTISASSGKDKVIIKIKDHGLGMDKETLENIFIPFYTKKSTGTGLGMPIAKKIIEGHQGKLHVISQPGKGTEIVIELPYKRK